MTETADIDDANETVFASVIGQERAVDRLRRAAMAPVHAYLFLGPQGSGRRLSARGFAALVLAADAADPERTRRLALEEKHPDLVVVEPQGATLRVVEAETIIRHGSITPVEGARKVIVVDRIDAIEEAAIGKLLKVIEEPPATAVFVLVAEEIPPEIVTIASRCVIIEFAPVATSLIEATLVGDGVDPGRAATAAVAAGGDLGRARLLAADDDLAARADLWAAVPGRLDGQGSTVVELTSQIREQMDLAQGVLESRHQTELEQLEARVELTGERGSGRADLVAKHKREIRRLRSDELRFGLATLSRHYRDRVLSAADRQASAALAAVSDTSEALIRNPNEALLLQHLLLELSPSPTTS